MFNASMVWVAATSLILNEGNKEVQQMTNYACTRDYAGYPDWQCHKWDEPETKTASPSSSQVEGTPSIATSLSHTHRDLM